MHLEGLKRIDLHQQYVTLWKDMLHYVVNNHRLLNKLYDCNDQYLYYQSKDAHFIHRSCTIRQQVPMGYIDSTYRQVHSLLITAVCNTGSSRGGWGLPILGPSGVVDCLSGLWHLCFIHFFLFASILMVIDGFHRRQRSGKIMFHDFMLAADSSCDEDWIPNWQSAAICIS